MKLVRRLALVASTLTLLAAAGCDGIVGLTPPAESEGESDDGSPGQGDDDASTRQGDEDARAVLGDEDGATSLPDSAGPMTDASVPLDSSDSEGMPSMDASAAQWPLSGVTAVGIAGSNLYVIENGGLFITTFGNGPPYPEPSLVQGGASSGISLTALATWSTDVFVGASNEILEASALDPTPPAEVVDIASSFPGMPLGPVIGLSSGTEGTHVYWTQTVGGTSCLLRAAVIDGGITQPMVLLMADAGDTFNAVAVDDTYAYTVGTQNGTLYAVVKEGDGPPPIPVARAVLPTSPIVAKNGAVYFVNASDGSQIYVGSAAVGEGMAYLDSGPVDTFALEGNYAFYGSGANVMYTILALVPPQPAPQPLVSTPGDSPIAGVAAANNYVSYFNASVLGLLPVPQ